jgi:hypothetical protein
MLLGPSLAMTRCSNSKANSLFKHCALFPKLDIASHQQTFIFVIGIDLLCFNSHLSRTLFVAVFVGLLLRHSMETKCKIPQLFPVGPECGITKGTISLGTTLSTFRGK